VEKAANFSPGHDHKLPTKIFQTLKNDNARPLTGAKISLDVQGIGP